MAFKRKSKEKPTAETFEVKKPKVDLFLNWLLFKAGRRETLEARDVLKEYQKHQE